MPAWKAANGDVTGDAAGALTLVGVGCATISLGVLHMVPTGLSWARNGVGQDDRLYGCRPISPEILQPRICQV